MTNRNLFQLTFHEHPTVISKWLVVDAMSTQLPITPTQSNFAIGKPWHQCAIGEHHSEEWMWQGADATSAQNPITPTHTLVKLGGWLCIQYVYVALLRNFTEINFTK